LFFQSIGLSALSAKLQLKISNLFVILRFE